MIGGSRPGGPISVGGTDLRSFNHPVLAYNSSAGRFHLVYSKFTYNDDTDGCLCSVDYYNAGGGLWLWGGNTCRSECTTYTTNWDNWWRTDASFLFGCNATNGCNLLFPNVVGPSEISSMMASYSSGSLATSNGGNISEYTNVGGGLVWFPTISRFLSFVKALWNPADSIRSRKSTCAGCAWTDLQTLVPTTLTGTSAAHASSPWNEVSMWYSRL